MLPERFEDSNYTNLRLSMTGASLGMIPRPFWRSVISVNAPAARPVIEKQVRLRGLLSLIHGVKGTLPQDHGVLNLLLTHYSLTPVSFNLCRRASSSSATRHRLHLRANGSSLRLRELGYLWRLSIQQLRCKLPLPAPLHSLEPNVHGN